MFLCITLYRINISLLFISRRQVIFGNRFGAPLIIKKNTPFFSKEYTFYMLRRLDSRGRDGRYERELAFFYKRLANNNLWALVSLSVKEKKRTFIPKVAAGFFFLVHSNSAQLRITSRSVQRHEYVSLTSAVALAATSWVRSLWNLPGII